MGDFQESEQVCTPPALQNPADLKATLTGYFLDIVQDWRRRFACVSWKVYGFGTPGTG